LIVGVSVVNGLEFIVEIDTVDLRYVYPQSLVTIQLVAIANALEIDVKGNLFSITILFDFDLVNEVFVGEIPHKNTINNEFCVP